ETILQYRQFEYVRDADCQVQGLAWISNSPIERSSSAKLASTLRKCTSSSAKRYIIKNSHRKSSCVFQVTLRFEKIYTSLSSRWESLSATRPPFLNFSAAKSFLCLLPS